MRSYVQIPLIPVDLCEFGVSLGHRAGVPGQPEMLHRETQSRKTKKKEMKEGRKENGELEAYVVI